MALTITTARSWTRDVWAFLTTLCLAVVWLRVSKAWEGPVLVKLDQDHGIALSDLVALVVAALACLGLLRSRRRPPKAPDEG